MKDYIQERVIEIAHYIIETGATVRETAKVFKVSKSTVHKDMSERLPRVNQTFGRGSKGPDKNKAERHIRAAGQPRLNTKWRMKVLPMKTPNKRGLEKFMIKFISKRGFYADM